MKNLLLSVLFIAFGSTATAGQLATVTGVHPSYQWLGPTQTCDTVQVPIYGNTHSSDGGNIIAGAIIGGAIGNQFGKGNGKTAMTALGAILGADLATNDRSRSNRIIGYEAQTQCYNNQDIQNVQDGYNVTYNIRGQFYSFHSYIRYRVGDRILVNY